MSKRHPVVIVTAKGIQVPKTQRSNWAAIEDASIYRTSKKRDAPPANTGEKMKWYENKSTSPLQLVHDMAEKLTGKLAVCSRCRFFTPVDQTTGVGKCAQRPGEPQFQFGVCLSWEAPQKPAVRPTQLRPTEPTPSPTKALQGAPEPVPGPVIRGRLKPR